MANNRQIVEIEDFISNVQAKTCLWDQSDSNYFKRDYQRVAWMDIADENRAPVSELKKRWRGLRDTFARELRKIDQSKSDAELAGASNWRHFHRLMFLREVVASTRKRLEGQEDTHVQRDVKEQLHQVNNGDDADMSGSDRSSSPGSDRRLTYDPVSVKQESGARFEDQARVDREVLNCGQNVQMDADAQFLMSLLPFLRDVPKKRKLLVRARLTQVLMDEQNTRQYN